MQRIAHFLNGISSWIFPTRAATRTWMILTFVVFVGIAVVAVALFMTFVLQADIRGTVEASLREDVERITRIIARAESVEEQLTLIHDVARINDIRVTFWNNDGVVGDARGTVMQAGRLLQSDPPLTDVAPGAFWYDYVARSPYPRTVYYVSHRPERSNATIRVAQPEPPLLALVRRLRITLAAGMVLAFAMALIGSWVAAQKVTRPLQAIRNSARSISKGDFDEMIHVESRAAEFQDLGDSLNRMSDSFREKIDELERLTRLQNEFLGNVSHEVRNPIFAVGGYLEALSMSNLSKALRERYAEKALGNLQRLANLFNDLIEIARLEFREDVVRPEVFNISELVDDVAEILRPKADARGVGLEMDNPELFVYADRNRLRQVIINLIENAVAYSDDGTVRCRIGRRLDKVRIEVIDEGRGMEEAHLERIFERFYRVDPDRSRKSGGTGLGLSIVRQILHAHGEAIRVESTVGRGSRFWFELPFAPEHEDIPA